MPDPRPVRKPGGKLLRRTRNAEVNTALGREANPARRRTQPRHQGRQTLSVITVKKQDCSLRVMLSRRLMHRNL